MGSKYLGRAVNVTLAQPGAPADAPSIFAVSGQDYVSQTKTADPFTFNQPLQGLGGGGLGPVASKWGRAFSGLHVRFKAEKNTLLTPNTLELNIYNLAAATRKQLQSYGMFVELSAGYQADLPTLPIAFRGTTRTIDHIRQGADWVTRIRSGDGEHGYRFGQANQTWPQGVLSSTIAIYLANQVKAADPLHIDVSAFIAAAPSLNYPVQAYANGYVAYGNAIDQLSLLIGFGYELSIQNGSLVAISTSGFTQSTGGIPLISPSTGLLGSPDHGDPNLAGLPSVLKVNCLMNARIQPGDLVQVVSSDTNGTFRVQKITHTGDLDGNDWQSEIEAYALGQTPGVAPL